MARAMYTPTVDFAVQVPVGEDPLEAPEGR